MSVGRQIHSLQIFIILLRFSTSTNLVATSTKNGSNTTINATIATTPITPPFNTTTNHSTTTRKIDTITSSSNKSEIPSNTTITPSKTTNSLLNATNARSDTTNTTNTTKTPSNPTSTPSNSTNSTSASANATDSSVNITSKVKSCGGNGFLMKIPIHMTEWEVSFVLSTYDSFYNTTLFVYQIVNKNRAGDEALNYWVLGSSACQTALFSSYNGSLLNTYDPPTDVTGFTWVNGQKIGSKSYYIIKFVGYVRLARVCYSVKFGMHYGADEIDGPDCRWFGGGTTANEQTTATPRRTNNAPSNATILYKSTTSNATATLSNVTTFIVTNRLNATTLSYSTTSNSANASIATTTLSNGTPSNVTNPLNVTTTLSNGTTSNVTNPFKATTTVSNRTTSNGTASNGTTSNGTTSSVTNPLNATTTLLNGTNSNITNPLNATTTLSIGTNSNITNPVNATTTLSIGTTSSVTNPLNGTPTNSNATTSPSNPTTNSANITTQGFYCGFGGSKLQKPISDLGWNVSLISRKYHWADDFTIFKYQILVDNNEHTESISYWVIGASDCTRALSMNKRGHRHFSKDIVTGVSGFKFRKKQNIGSTKIYVIKFSGNILPTKVCYSVKGSKYYGAAEIDGPNCSPQGAHNMVEAPYSDVSTTTGTSSSATTTFITPTLTSNSEVITEGQTTAQATSCGVGGFTIQKTIADVEWHVMFIERNYNVKRNLTIFKYQIEVTKSPLYHWVIGSSGCSRAVFMNKNGDRDFALDTATGVSGFKFDKDQPTFSTKIYTIKFAGFIKLTKVCYAVKGSKYYGADEIDGPFCPSEGSKRSVN